jgi:hypothetical protein
MQKFDVLYVHKTSFKSRGSILNNRCARGWGGCVSLEKKTSKISEEKLNRNVIEGPKNLINSKEKLNI